MRQNAEGRGGRVMVLPPQRVSKFPHWTSSNYGGGDEYAVNKETFS